MIYTITFSPSIDYVVNNQKNKFDANGLTRIEKYNLFPGGKGINASYILNELKLENEAIIYTYGKTKQLFLELLEKHNLKNVSEIDVESNLDIRINLKYFGFDNKFEINGPSIKIDENNLNKLKNKLSNINQKDVVFIMGKCDESVLIDLIEFIRNKKANFVIDIDSNILLQILKYHPFVIKPNIDELQLILNKKFMSDNEVLNAMKDLKKQGALNVIVSMGSEGSLLLDDKNEAYKINFDPIKNLKSTVGCGDTLLSSYVGFKMLNLSNEESIKKATAMSMSTASSWFLGSYQEMEILTKDVKVKKI